MKVYFVGAGPGAPDLLTIRGKALLEKATCCIYAGSLINPWLLELLPQGCEKYNSADMSLEEIIQVIKNARGEGADVVRLHSGDPSIYGAINEQMERLDELGVEYEVVPGVSSFQASAAAMARELTIPEITQTVILTRGKGRTPVPEREGLKALAAHRATMCIFLSAALINEVVDELVGEYGEDCPAAAVYKATWPEQKIIQTTLSLLPQAIEEAGITRTALIFVGPALGSKGTRSKLYEAR